ncbi:MAG: GMC oxidoreductase [Dongiaceae bacterium]
MPVRHDLPGVGANLQDHVDVSLRQASDVACSMTGLLWEPRRTLTGLRWLLGRRGLAATNHFEAQGYLRSRDGLALPNIQLCFIPLLVGADGRPIGRRHGYQATVMLLRPSSRGRVAIAGADPALPPRLLFNYLGDPDEVAQLVEGLQAVRRIFAQPAFRRFDAGELEPGPAARDDAALAGFVRRTAKSTHHPCGTCRMGAPDDPDAVVDPAGRVHGLEGLRVADASIMPVLTRGNINAPVLMLAEKLAAAIAGP